jgi:hypothetical protein
MLFRPMLKTPIIPMVFIGILGEISPKINFSLKSAFSLKINFFTQNQLLTQKCTFRTFPSGIVSFTEMDQIT